MENEKDETIENNNDETGNLQQTTFQDEKKPVAKDLVQLKHVEVKKQEISKETKELVEAIKTQVLKQDQSKELSNDEITILESFIGKRLFLTRIAIVINQSRIPLGIEPLKRQELETLLDRLIFKGYIDFTIIEDKRVYFLTEKGRELLQ